MNYSYLNAASFAAGALTSFSITGSLRMVDESEKLPDIGFDRYKPATFTASAGLLGGYEPASLFLAGVAGGTYSGDRFYEEISGDLLEETYRENGLGDLWEELEEDY